MFNTFDSIPNALTAKALANNFNQEEKDRREACVINKNHYYGASKQYVSTFNLEVDVFTLNLTKPVVGKRASLLYNGKLIREMDGPAESVNFLEQLYEDNDIDSFLGSVDLMAELTGSTLVSIVPWEDYTSGWKLQMWDGSQVSALSEEEDPSTAAAVSLVKLIDKLQTGWDKGQPSNDRKLKQQVWTKQSIVTYEGDINVKSEKNPYGFIPFTNFKGEEVPGQYIGWSPATVVRQLNTHINQMLTDLAYTIKMQAASPVTLTGYQSGESLVITPGRAISLPAGADAKVLNFSPKLTETLDTMKYLEEKIYETSSVPKVCVVGGEGTSGRELLVRWFPLIQVFKEKAVRFNKYEKQLANMILKMNGLEPLKDLQVHYPEEDQLPLSPTEETLERDIILGIRTPVDEIIRRNPHISEEEAISQIIANNDINLAIGLAGEEEPVEEQPVDLQETV